MSLMLPSPASSGSFEFEMQCNRRSSHNSYSKTSDCALAPSKGEGSPTGDERIQPEHKLSLDRNKEIDTVGADSTDQAFPEEHKGSEGQQFPGISQQIGDNINSLDSDSSVIFILQESDCTPIGCTSTQERSSRSSNFMILEGKCQTANNLSDRISTFRSPSIIDSLNRDSTQYQDIQQYPMSKMHSSQYSKSEDHADGYLNTIQNHGSAEDIVETASGRELRFTHKDITDMGFSGQRQLSEHDTATPQLQSDKMTTYASPDAAIPDTNTSSDTVSNMIDCEVPADTVLVGQKRTHEERQDVSRKHRRFDQPLTACLANDECKYTLPSQSSILGSLSTFMETRGRVNRQQVTAVSPYFTKNIRVEDIVGHQDPAIDTRSLHKYEVPKDTLEEVQPLGLELTKQRYPQYPQLEVQNDEQPLLFLSTALLKSHLSIIRGLERLKRLPVMIYRDYDVLIRNLPVPRIWIPSQVNTKHDLPREADIIISPTTGIILTTLQATTQLYLPGHKPNPQTNGNKYINSPLRERIFLLAPRYKYLYVFVAHGTSSPRSGGGNASRWTADRRLLASFTSLIAFCDAMSVDSVISPILISLSSDTTIGWIQALAHKHTFQLPTDTVNLPQSIAFTPVNPTPKIKLDIEAMENETRYELFLRRVGLNPYAAQIILTVLRQEGETPIRNNNSSAPDDVENEMSSLSRFIEMSPECRRRVFPDLIWKKIDAILEKDWQCDWALNFDY